MGRSKNPFGHSPREYEADFGERSPPESEQSSDETSSSSDGSESPDPEDTDYDYEYDIEAKHPGLIDTLKSRLTSRAGTSSGSGEDSDLGGQAKRAGPPKKKHRVEAEEEDAVGPSLVIPAMGKGKKPKKGKKSSPVKKKHSKKTPASVKPPKKSSGIVKKKKPKKKSKATIKKGLKITAAGLKTLLQGTKRQAALLERYLPR